MTRQPRRRAVSATLSWHFVTSDQQDSCSSSVEAGSGKDHLGLAGGRMQRDGRKIPGRQGQGCDRPADRNLSSPGLRISAELHEKRAHQAEDVRVRSPNRDDRNPRVQQEWNTSKRRRPELRIVGLQTDVCDLFGQPEPEPDAGGVRPDLIVFSEPGGVPKPDGQPTERTAVVVPCPCRRCCNADRISRRCLRPVIKGPEVSLPRLL